MSSLLPLVGQHMLLVSVAVVIAAVAGVALAILAYWVPSLRGVILWTAEAIQTIPSLALLTLLMIFFGLGDRTLVAGLVLYALLPIIRNTHTGLAGIPAHLKDAARGVGMSRLQRLVKLELPLSFPMIFAGLKIAIVNSLSVAVMGVLIGAGGLGYPIYRGIQTRNLWRMLSAALPVVLMALAFDFVMSKIERRLVRK